MSISASEKGEWAESEQDHSNGEGPSDLQEELIRVMNKAVQELELAWNPPEEPAKSKLDSWYFRSSHHRVDTRTSVPFFPDVHDQLIKTWSAHQSAHVHSATQAMFSQVDGAEAHGYVCMPPVKETVAAQLCPASAKTMGSDISLPSKPCRMTAHLASKAYSSAGEGASALHAMAVLQVFQAKLLQSLEGGTTSPVAVNDLRAATDFTLMATKCAAQAIGRTMGFMLVQQRHLWLTLADLKDSDRKVLLNAPITPSGLFGDTVDSIIERFAEAQKRAKAMSHVMPRRSFQSPSRSRSSSATRPPQRREERPAAATAVEAPRREPDVRRKVWPGPGKGVKDSGGALVETCLSSLRHFRQGSSVHLKEFQRLLGLMALASSVCHLGLLHMHLLQLWLKSRVPWTSRCLSIVVTRGCIEALMPWCNPDLFSRGVPLGSVSSRVVVTTDASTHGWGAVCKGMPASGLWSEPQSRWHINRLELEAVF